MRSHELEILCKRLGEVAHSFTIGATYNDKTPVIFNDTIHFFNNLDQYCQYQSRNIENPCAGIVVNDDGRLRPTCAYIPYDVYSDVYGNDEDPNDVELWEQRWLNVPFNEGDIIEYWKKDNKGETYRYVSYIVKDELGFHIYSDEKFSLNDISIIIRQDEEAEDELYFRLRGENDEI